MDDFNFDGGDLPETPSTPTTDDTTAGGSTTGGDDAGMPADDAGMPSSDPGMPASNTGTSTGGGMTGGDQGGRTFAKEIFSVEHRGRYRTFYFDVKESPNGKFLKIKEKGSGGRSSVIMMDAEDVAPVIEAMQKVQEQL